MARTKITALGPVVMVDDSPADTFIAARCAERSSLGRELVHLHSGRALLAYLAEVARGSKPMPCLLLLDIDMPRMNGFDVLRKVRAMPDLSEELSVTILSNSDDPSDIQKSKDLGANNFASKPRSMHDFIAFFDSLEP